MVPPAGEGLSGWRPIPLPGLIAAAGWRIHVGSAVSKTMHSLPGRRSAPEGRGPETLAGAARERLEDRGGASSREDFPVCRFSRRPGLHQLRSASSPNVSSTTRTSIWLGAESRCASGHTRSTVSRRATSYWPQKWMRCRADPSRCVRERCPNAPLKRPWANL